MGQKAQAASPRKKTNWGKTKHAMIEGTLHKRGESHIAKGYGKTRAEGKSGEETAVA